MHSEEIHQEQKKSLKKWGLILAMACVLSGCGKVQPAEDAQVDEFDNLISVGFTQIGSESLWRDANTKSIQNTLTKENGYFLLFNNARQKQENQIKAIRSYISQRVDYILFSPVTQDGWETVLMEAKEAEIPVILVDRQVSSEYEDLYTAWVGTSSEEEGEKAGRWLEDYLSEQEKDESEVKIAILTGTIGSSAQIGRSGGFQKIASKHSNWKIVANECGEFTTARGKEVMEEILMEHPDIDVLVSQNDDMTLGAIEAMENAGVSMGTDGVAIISFDAAREALELVKKGTILVDVECNALQGPYIDELIQKLQAGEEVPKMNLVDEEVFTSENVSEAIENRLY